MSRLSSIGPTPAYEVHDIDFRLVANGGAALPPTTQNGIFEARGYKYLSVLSPYPINPENGQGPAGRCRIQFDQGLLAVQSEIVNYRMPDTKKVRFFNLQDAFDNRRPRGGSGPGRIILSTDPLPYNSRPMNLLIPLTLALGANIGPGPLVRTYVVAWGFETDTTLAWARYLTGYAPHREVRAWYNGLPLAGHVLTFTWNAAYPAAAPTLLPLTAQIPAETVPNPAGVAGTYQYNPLTQASGSGYGVLTDTMAAAVVATDTRVWFMFCD